MMRTSNKNRCQLAFLAGLLAAGIAAAKPSASLTCDTLPLGGWSINTDTAAQQAVDAQIFVEMVADGDVQLPLNSTCDLANPTITPKSACSQTVAGTKWIVSFDASFANCLLVVSVKANAFEALPTNGSDMGAITINKYLVDVQPTTSDEMIIPLWGQCGGAAGDCQMMAKMMGMPACDFCIDGDWPGMQCEAGSECMIASKWYRQCRPYSHDLKCPPPTGTSGGFTPVTGIAQQKKLDAAVWANLTATNNTGMPVGTGCNVSAPMIKPLRTCSQVVSGTTYITSFKASFPNCPLYTTVDANAFMPTGKGKTLQVNGFRVAPYESSVICGNMAMPHSPMKGISKKSPSTKSPSTASPKKRIFP